MGESEFQHTQIETLKEKLLTYKQTLEAIKTGDMVEDYLVTKKECQDLKEELSFLKEEIQLINTDKQEYDKNVKFLKTQFDLLNDTINHLKQEVNLLRSKDNINVEELLIKLDKMVQFQYDYMSLIKEGNNEINSIKDDIDQLKKQISESVTNSTNLNVDENVKRKRPSSDFKQLQNILKAQNKVEPYSGDENDLNHKQMQQPGQYSRNERLPENNQIKRSLLNRPITQQQHAFNKISPSKQRINNDNQFNFVEELTDKMTFRGQNLDKTIEKKLNEPKSNSQLNERENSSMEKQANRELFNDNEDN